ncbi:SusC/RagA family TonB-linked outer membrane protein [Olleya sp. Bg11-27]|uniref:SusC/RagA family TonB-linked outer membrane protein n=1 Tax=Olleya sp. Bg11-27 TaxID=2058135 RepID=UPI000C30D5DD|nr:SusC/RagA family TonB-linked outer membrane protein [Olleya sp. Bg11-27]AUC77487.1 SusC/RagA family TonB-linked outer membrane protein [Olleya sp. Bg11-27]
MKTKFSGILTLFLAFVVQITFAQDKTVSGIISDDNGLPLPSATVVVDGTSTGISTDFDGKYAIKAKVGDKLKFSYVGYSNKVIVVGSESTINVSLSPDNALDEVVITAFGSKKRDELTSAVTTLSSDDIAKLSPTTSIDNMLQGVAPGVQVVAGNGKPGQTAFVRIRGVGSVNASSAPLYVIDGIIAPDLSSVNPSEIETMSILKDAATASLYGARAANGVVIIKTKSGNKNREARVTINSRVGFGQKIEDNFEMMDAAQKIQYERELNALGVSNAAATAGAGITTAAEYNSLVSRNTDWQEELLKNSYIQSNSISVDGGTEKASYFFSLAHDRATGIIATIDGFERLSGRMNVNMQAKDWLNISTNLSVSTTSSDEPRDRNNVQNPFRAMYDYNPYETKYVLDADNNVVLDSNGNPEYNRTSAGFSVAEALVNNTEVEYNTYIIGGVSAVANLTDHWTNTFKMGASNTAFRRESWLKPGSILDQIVGDPDNPGSKTDNGSNELDMTITNLLSYNTTIAEKHNLTVTGLFEYNKRTFRTYSLTSIGFANDFQGVQAVATLPTATSTNYFERALVSYGGFLDYDYEGKYLATASLRRDGSSTFGANNRYGTFWSGSAAWNLSKENFLKDNNYIDDLKLRVSAGTSGNSNGLASYASIAVIDFGSLNGQSAAIPSDNGNADLGFEKNFIWGIGTEFTAFNRRLRGVVDYYERTTSDLLLNANLSSFGGEPDGSIFSNIGEMVNKGVEVELSYDLIKGEDVGDFNLTVGGNIAFIDNEVTKLVPTAAAPEGEDIIVGNSIIKVGEEIYTYNMVGYAGVNPANGEPLFFDADGNVTNVYNASNTQVLSGKSPLADFDGGINLFMTYKGFDLGADFYYKSGNYIENLMENSMLSDGTGVDSNQRLDAFNYWRNPGDTNVLPSPLFGVAAQQSSDRFLQKGDYIRLRNLSIGYKLPSIVTNKMNIKSLRLYVQGQNLWTYAPYFNGDPEVGIGSGETANAVGFGNFNLYSYPTQQSIQLGLELQF